MNISGCASVSKLQKLFLMSNEYELVEQENVVLAANFDDLCDSRLKPYLIKPVHVRGLHSIQIEMLLYRMHGKNQVRRFILICIVEQARNNNDSR